MHFNNAFQSMSHDLMMTCWTYLIIIMILIHYEFTKYDELWWIINYDELFTVRIPKSSRSEHRHHSGRHVAPVWKTEAAPGAVGGGGDVPRGLAMPKGTPWNWSITASLENTKDTKVTMMSSELLQLEDIEGSFGLRSWGFLHSQVQKFISGKPESKPSMLCTRKPV